MNHKRNQGFTLIEIAVVVAVISIIAAITIVSFNQVQRDSRDRKRTSDMIGVEAALDSYFRDNNEYPPVCVGGDDATCNLSSLAASLAPRYIPALPTDPSGSQYQYVRSSATSSPTGYGAGSGYGLLVNYETQPQCKAGIHVWSNWWGSGVPACNAPL